MSTDASGRKQFRNVAGVATELKIDPELAGASTTVAAWMLEGAWHPLWSQFILCVVHLREEEGVPEPKLRFPGASHELSVMALPPENGPHSYETFEKGGFKACGGFLSPIDVSHQFEATDEEMIQLVEFMAEGVVGGRLNPSTDDNRAVYREQWLMAAVRTLAHMRGEEHAP